MTSTPTEDRKMTESEERETERKGNNDRAIALIAESITTALDKINAIIQKATAEKQSFAMRIQKADEATSALGQNVEAMQKILATAKTCREEGTDFDATDIAPQSKVYVPLMLTKAGNEGPIAAPTTESWPALPIAKSDTTHAAVPTSKTVDVEKESF